MKFAKFIFLLLVTLPILVNGQNSESYTRDTTLVNNYLDSTRSVFYTNNKLSKSYVDIIDSISNVINYDYGLSQSNLFKGIFSFIDDDYVQSINYYKKSIEYCDKEKVVNLSNLYTNISMSYGNLNKFDSSIYYLDKVTSIISKKDYPLQYTRAVFEKAGVRINQEKFIDALKYIEEGEKALVNISDSSNLIGFYSIIGNFYRNVNDFDKAFVAFKKSIDYGKNNEVYKKKYIDYFNIAYLYMSIKQDYDSALYYCYKGIEANEASFNPRDSLSVNIQIGNVFFEKGDIDSSAFYYLRAYNNTAISNFPKYKSAVLINLGLYYKSKKQYNKATDFYLQGKEIAQEYGFLKFQENALEGLADIEEQNKNYKLAFQYYNEYNTIRDSLKIEEANRQIDEMEYKTYQITSKYKNEKLKGEIDSQEQKIFIQRIGLFVFIAFLALLVLVLIFVNKSKKKIHILNDKLNDSINELTKLSEFKENMTNMIVHDLKNPLSTIINIDVIEDEELKTAMVQHSGYRMLNLIENILNVYKYENTKMQLQKENTPLLRVVDNSIKEIAFLTEKKSLNIIIDSELNSIVNIDKEIIRRVFVNLLTNAVKFSPQNSEIKINAKISDSSIIISVINQGPVINKESYDVIFEPFGQAEKKSSGNIASTGLGLAFCKMAIEAHGGKIAVKSDEINGTKFWFDLPESFISKENIAKEDIKAQSLSSKDIELLKPIISRLNMLEVYEISSIDNILSSIDNNAENIQKWINSIREASYKNDTDRFNELLNLNYEL